MQSRRVSKSTELGHAANISAATDAVAVPYSVWAGLVRPMLARKDVRASRDGAHAG